MSIKQVCQQAGRWAAVLGLITAGILLGGCSSPPPRTGAADPPGAASGPPSSDKDRVFHPGQQVKVEFTDLPTPVQPYEVTVKEDGTVTLLLNKVFTFAGKTQGQVEQEIRKCYVPDYFKYMTVTVNWPVQTRFYYVDGEVKLPNRQTYIERTTVLKAIASAGGFTDFAKKTKVILVRLDGRKYTINCKKAITHPDLDLEVLPGDKVIVPRRIF